MKNNKKDKIIDPKKIDCEKTGKFIAKLRNALGLTQDELGELLFISRKSVSKWETGRAYPSIDMLNRLASILGVTFDELIAGQFLDKKSKKRDIIFKIIKIIKTKAFRIASAVFLSFCILLVVALSFYKLSATRFYSLNYEDDNFSFVNGIVRVTPGNSYINFGTTNFLVADVDEDTEFNYTLYYYDSGREVDIISFSDLDISYLDNSTSLDKYLRRVWLKPLFLRVMYKNIYNEEKVYNLKLDIARKTDDGDEIILKDDVIMTLSDDEIENFNVKFLFDMNKDEIKETYDGKSITVDKKKYKLTYDKKENMLEIKNNESKISILFKAKIIIMNQSFVNIDDDYMIKWKDEKKSDKLAIIKTMKKLQLLFATKQ